MAVTITPTLRSVGAGAAAAAVLIGALALGVGRRNASSGAQIQAAVHAGGNVATVNGISLTLTDTSGLLATARARAVADARAKAVQYAQALGQPLGPVVSISDQTQAPSPLVPMALPAAGKASSVPISPGSQQLSISVTVVYALA